ncbi:uncharacterized protein LOC114311159 [Camellia sinensis]|uniref:uncharacterized protein LOC114311159 n=1 Tax=Camellia sinensis TaxID=4442 RepID=UPI001035BAF7|nr:uncharacterized protein LOC114311159 [Camellia sinensis]
MEYMSVDSEGSAGGLLCIFGTQRSSSVMAAAAVGDSFSSQETTVRGGPGQALLQKLKLLKLALKKWNSEVFGNMSTNLKAAESAFLGDRNILDGVLIANEVVDGWKKSKKKARLSVLVNGSPTTEFSPQRDLRQGDPLSPFLFNLVVEGLNILMTRAYELNLLKGVKIERNEVVISHLQFADDSIIFREADREQCNGLPLKFLGLSLGENHGRKSTWKPVLDKIKSRLAG